MSSFGGREGYTVPPLRRVAIRDFAAALRGRFGLADEARFPVIDFLERVLDQRLNMTRTVIADAHDMGGAEGLTCPSGDFVMLRTDVYDGALAWGGRPRFTIAHEIGHLLLHANRPLARRAQSETVPAYKCSEWQADQFAAEVLMPFWQLCASDTPAVVAKRHAVSYHAAEVRLAKLKSEGVLKGTPSSFPERHRPKAQGATPMK